ncbi:HAMP domain-containing sensor histidine kinase [Sphingobium sp.]|uniref:sensor histidine kinase n=1 Tax=Sphingobium sp. TaxID=1912891 RepID=UPI002C8CCD22|nr:HAMP domain-containing sensor histidine kinase [Sphingobium sp.]HUD90036.1 HAMP domain-containing sensor histidine kinase [Sphingobium sp.]
MTLLPRSIRSRLLLIGAFLTGFALLVASLSISGSLEQFVRRSLNDRLDTQIALLLRSIRPDGTVDGTMLSDIGPFTQHRRGWGWVIEAPSRTYASRDVAQLDRIHWEGPPGREGHFRGAPESLRAGRTDAAYVRTLEKQTAAGVIRITAFAPIGVLNRLRGTVILPVIATLGVLSLALLAATFVQLHFGLKPLARLQEALTAVRTGRLDRVPAHQPSELAPLVAVLNALLDENEAALARARGHVANLAHSLKTPLATLSIRLTELDHDSTGQLGELVGRIDGAIRHHLGRARAASPGAPGNPLVPLAATVDELVLALGRIHAERRISFVSDVSPDLAVKCDPQDLAEMLGNLLDNAWKWAESGITVAAEEVGSAVRIAIEDDGPGLAAEAIDQALVPGRRLDEREEGHGFGLPIARELAELHGGSLELGRAATGGLRVVLTLPR